jgi:heterodisulfide reductase subunit C
MIVSEKHERFIEEMKERSGQDPARCLQCAKCSAACPAVEAMDLLPHQVIRFLQLGFSNTVCESRTPWVCASCFTCAARCPRDLDLARMMEGVRLVALRKREGNRLSPGAIDPELLKELPQQALVSGFRKYNK